MNAFDMLFKIQELQLTKDMLASAKPLSPEDKADLILRIADKIQQKHPDKDYEECLEQARRIVG